MSKITQAKKEAKLKGKAAKTAAAQAAPADAKPTASAASQLPNYGKCCTCTFYGKPCSKTKTYVPRKAEKSCYKMKG